MDIIVNGFRESIDVVIHGVVSIECNTNNSDVVGHRNLTPSNADRGDEIVWAR